MTPHKGLAIVVCVFALGACPKADDGSGAALDAGSAHSAGTGGHGASAAGSGGSSSAGRAGHPSAGAAGNAAGGTSAASGGSDCRNVAIPALCKLCADGSCGNPTCSGGMFTGFVCPTESDAGMHVCNALCVKGKHCDPTQTPQCVDDDAGVADAGTAPTCGGFAGLACPGLGECVDVPNDGCDPQHGGADCAGQCQCTARSTCAAGETFDSTPSVCACTGSGSSGLHWFASCGSPVCSADTGKYDDPNIPNCTTEQIGQACTSEGQRCDGVLSCGQTLICAQEAPRTCPISRAAYKQDIRYLDDAERARFHDQITQLRLASYRYKTAPDVPQLGFMIDDVEPSVAVSGDHVNLYAYLSMAVAAIQVQDQQIKSLERQLEALRAKAEPSATPICEPAAPARGAGR